MNTKINRFGYEVLDKCDRNYQHIMIHQLLAEDMFGGEIPRGLVVHHIDGDRKNNDIDNLMVLSRASHNTIHRFMRAKLYCGKPHYRKCKYCKQYDHPKNLTFSSSGYAYEHRECKLEMNRKIRKSRKT